MNIFSEIKKIWLEIYKNILFCNIYYKYKYSSVKTKDDINNDNDNNDDINDINENDNNYEDIIMLMSERT